VVKLKDAEERRGEVFITRGAKIRDGEKEKPRDFVTGKNPLECETEAPSADHKKGPKKRVKKKSYTIEKISKKIRRKQGPRDLFLGRGRKDPREK